MGELLDCFFGEPTGFSIVKSPVCFLEVPSGFEEGEELPDCLLEEPSDCFLEESLGFSEEEPLGFSDLFWFDEVDILFFV